MTISTITVVYTPCAIRVYWHHQQLVCKHSCASQVADRLEYTTQVGLVFVTSQSSPVWSFFLHHPLLSCFSFRRWKSQDKDLKFYISVNVRLLFNVVTYYIDSNDHFLHNFVTFFWSKHHTQVFSVTVCGIFWLQIVITYFTCKLTMNW